MAIDGTGGGGLLPPTSPATLSETKIKQPAGVGRGYELEVLRDRYTFFCSVNLLPRDFLRHSGISSQLSSWLHDFFNSSAAI